MRACFKAGVRTRLDKSGKEWERECTDLKELCVERVLVEIRL